MFKISEMTLGYDSMCQHLPPAPAQEVLMVSVDAAEEGNSRRSLLECMTHLVPQKSNHSDGIADRVLSSLPSHSPGEI